MKIVFYSTNSNHYAQGKMDFRMIPSCADQWKELKDKYPHFDFTVVMQKPGMFIYDDDGNKIQSGAVKYIFVEEKDSSAEKIAALILEQKPDVAIAITYWTQPFDWMAIKDSMIAEILQNNNVKTVCHDLKTSEICFDKYRTHQFLTENNFNCAKAVYVHHEMFYAERSRLVIAENIYKENVLSQIKKLKLPLVIKDTLGLSSFGMDVVTTYDEARHILTSKRNNGDRLVEEFLQGPSFGVEVYGTDGNYTVTDPLINSVNQFGLTSPKQNVKLGPAVNQRLHIPELKKEILRLANLLNFSGIAQIDLLFSDDKWYIIEINSRISGMTQTMAASMKKSLYELILFSAGLVDFEPEYSSVMNLKFPLLSEDKRKLMSKQKFVCGVNQIENKEARQLREVGYSEVIFGQNETINGTMENLETLKSLFPEEMEMIFYNNARKLAEYIKK